MCCVGTLTHLIFGEKWRTICVVCTGTILCGGRMGVACVVFVFQDCHPKVHDVQRVKL